MSRNAEFTRIRNRIVAHAVGIGVVGLQIAAFVPAFDARDSFPFVDYPMYSKPPNGDLIETQLSEIRVETRAGENLSEGIRWMRRFGMGQVFFKAKFFDPMVNGNEAVAAALVRRISHRRPDDPVVRIVVSIHRYRLDDTGLHPVGSKHRLVYARGDHPAR